MKGDKEVADGFESKPNIKKYIHENLDIDIVRKQFEKDVKKLKKQYQIEIKELEKDRNQRVKRIKKILAL